MKQLICLAFVLSLCACGQEKSEKYSYNLTENQCPTYEHKFSSLADYCAGLKNDELNNNCAWSMRRATYERDCGTDWAFYGGN